MPPKNICLIGCGNMGEALICGMLDSRLMTAYRITGVDIDRKRLLRIKRTTGINVTNDVTDSVRKADIIIIAVKPRDVEGMLSEIKSSLTMGKLMISVAAGITTSRIENLVGKRNPVIRVMPNAPALIREGVSAVARGRYATKKAEDIAVKIMSSVGVVVRVREELMDAATGLSGSGPAYIFYVIESMLKSGRVLGLDEKTAAKLVLHTVSGAADMALKTGQEPSLLRKKVTSPGGTTEAAIKYLEKRKFQKTLIDAVRTAARRSKEIGNPASPEAS